MVGTEQLGPTLIVDSSLATTIDSLRRSPLSPKDSIFDIRATFVDIVEAQELLARLGYGTLITGTLDAETKAAVHRFEAHHGLPPTGDPHSTTFGLAAGIVRDSIAVRVEGGLPGYTFTFGPRGRAFAEGVWVRKEGGLWESASGTARIACGAGRCNESDQVPWSPFEPDQVYEIISASDQELIAKSEGTCASQLLTFRLQDSTVLLETGRIGASQACGDPKHDAPPLRLVPGYEAARLALERKWRFLVLPSDVRGRLQSFSVATRP